MSLERKESLAPLLASENEIHLTIYLDNRQGLPALRRQLRGLLLDARESLEPALAQGELSAFLAPIEGLLEDDRTLRRMRGSVGLFRTRSAFRVLGLPIRARSSCHVATSFHVKPLLKWMQWDSEFLLLGLESESAQLYVGSQESLRRIDSAPIPARLQELLAKGSGLGFQESRELKEIARRAFSWMSEWIEESSAGRRPKLFMAGEKRLVNLFFRNQSYSRTIKAPVALYFSEEGLPEIVSQLRSQLHAEAKRSLEQVLLTFHVADSLNLTEKSIRKIARAAIEGRVKKLVIAENREIFGKLDPRTGELAIHPFDLDHEDDDLLDDLAQQVLRSGGEVYVASKDEIPNGRPILAILDGEREPVEMRVAAPTAP